MYQHINQWGINNIFFFLLLQILQSHDAKIPEVSEVRTTRML